MNEIIENKGPFGDFEVTCKQCGSANVEIDNSFGWSEISGS